MRLYLDQYAPLTDLFAPLRFNLVVDSVIEGNTPAWVFADKASSPKSGLMWDQQDAVLAAGVPDGDLLAVLLQEIAPDARRRWIPELCFFYDSPAWVELLSAAAEKLRIKPAERRYYRFQGVTRRWRELLPEDFTLRRIDPYLLQNENILNAGQVAGWVSSFWATHEDFSRMGFGYCAMAEDAIASWCLTVFASRDQRELGLATVPEYQGKGLATTLAAACVAHCQDHGLTPHWHCWEDNLPSRRVAEKVGFVGPVRYEVLRLGL